ncbi:hypothetical protein P43SY_006585 [Pythium insidiosum]|uniref:Uncharacterized protein n=1 Tax=Pythium insidiosum TaxID=114742 RepID=A0AAD5Q5F5_PYTIN|nr:hypothetical protein P43SY_006585 [Pythium insidiosum]
MELGTATHTRVCVLRALLSPDDLSSAEEWSDVLIRCDTQSIDAVKQQEQRSSAEAPLSFRAIIAVVGSVVPCLPEYKTFRSNLCGLLKFCETQSREELFNVIVQWLETPSHAIAFRRWLYEWIASDSQRVADVDSERWGHALRVAALQEHDTDLHQRVLRLVERDGELDGRTTATATATRPSDIERFLAFCWRNDAALAPVALLCAVKCASLLEKAGGDNRDDDHIHASAAATLRWSQALKPLLFRNLVEYLPVVRHSLQPLGCCLSPALQSLVNSTNCKPALEVLTATAASLSELAQRNVPHVRLRDSAVESLEQLLRHDAIDSPDTGNALVAELALVHSHVFPHVLALAFALTINHRDEMEDAVLPGLLVLLASREDEPSRFLVLSAILLLRLAHAGIWKTSAPLGFVEAVRSLSEDAVLATDSTSQWIQRTALHHLLFECDADVLATHWQIVERVAPSATLALVQCRLRGQDHVTAQE